MNKKFEIIEEGRLSKSEMNKINGGDTTLPICVPSNQYVIIDGCLEGGTVNYSKCPNYRSCTNTGYVLCNPYKGGTGPAGYTVLDGTKLTEDVIRFDVLDIKDVTFSAI